MNRHAGSWIRRISLSRPATEFLVAWTCRHCCSDAVAIGERCADGLGRRTYVLRCGECGNWRQLTMPSALAARFEASIQMHRAAIARNAEQLARRAALQGTPQPPQRGLSIDRGLKRALWPLC